MYHLNIPQIKDFMCVASISAVISFWPVALTEAPTPTPVSLWALIVVGEVAEGIQ